MALMRSLRVYPSDTRVENWDDSRMVSIKKATTDSESRVEEARAVIRLAIRVGRMVELLASVSAEVVTSAGMIAVSEPASSPA